MESTRKHRRGSAVDPRHAKIGDVAANQRSAGKKALRVWLPVQLESNLVKRAAAEGMNRTEAVTQAIEEWLARPPSSPGS